MGWKEALMNILIILSRWLFTGTLTSAGILAILFGALKNDPTLFLAGILIIGMIIEETADLYGKLWFERMKEGKNEE